MCLKEVQTIKKCRTKMLIKDIIYDICDTFQISESSFWRIKNLGPFPPKKTKSNRVKYTFCDNDYEIIDHIILDLNKHKYCVFVKDVYTY